MSETKTVWHKYPEELPPDDGRYLITAHDYGDTIEHPRIDVDFFDKDAGRFLLLDWDGTDRGWCVTAWAELPAAYQKAEAGCKQTGGEALAALCLARLKEMRFSSTSVLLNF